MVGQKFKFSKKRTEIYPKIALTERLESSRQKVNDIRSNE